MAYVSLDNMCPNGCNTETEFELPDSLYQLPLQSFLQPSVMYPPSIYSPVMYPPSMYPSPYVLPNGPPQFVTQVCDSMGRCTLQNVVPSPPLPTYSSECSQSANTTCAFTPDPLSCQIGVRSAIQGVDPPIYTDPVKNVSSSIGYKNAMSSCGVTNNGWQIVDN